MIDREKLRAAILAKCNTQSEFARIMGYTRQYVSNVIAGTDTLSLEQLVAWSRALGVDYRSLLVPDPTIIRDGLESELETVSA